MKIIKSTILVALLFSGIAVLASEEADVVKKQNQYKKFILSAGQVYTLYVKKGDGVTTVTFPSGIGKIAGYNICQDPNQMTGSADFQIMTKPGSYFFSLTALSAGSNATINISYNRKTYILYLVHDPDKAYAAVNFTFGDGSKRYNAINRPKVTSGRLFSMINQTKVYDALIKKYPGTIQQTLRSKKNDTFKYGKFNIILLDVVRFNSEDTLIFKILLENLTDKIIKYDKFTFSVQLKNKTYFMSAADASGIMIPKSKTWAFFSITGTPTGGRNNLAPDNNFLVGLTTDYMQKQLDLVATGNSIITSASSPLFSKKVMPVATPSSDKKKVGQENPK